MTERDAFELGFHAAVRGYVGRVSSDLDAAGLAHRIAAAEPRRHGFAATVQWRGVSIPRAAWLLLLVGLLLAALAGTALVASRLRETAPVPPLLDVALVPTGIDVLTPETGWYARVVADGDEVLWAREDVGRLVRYDPATGSALSWNVGDDAAFATWDIAPAREGGVWLVGQRTLRWFDGEVFREVIEAPAEIAQVAVAPDGSPWVTTGEGDVLHWDGSSWERLPSGRSYPDWSVGAIAVDTSGRPWIGGFMQVGAPPEARSGWVSRYDGSTWTTFETKGVAPLESAVTSIAELPDGAVWVATTGGLARFDGSSWTDATAQLSGARNTTSVAAGPDGTIWAAAGDPGDGAVTVRRFDGRSWVSYGPSDGLPGGDESGFVTAWALPMKDGVYAGTGAGIYRLNADRWERAWPSALALEPIDFSNLLAVSRDELWATDILGEHLSHFQGGTWTSDPVDPRQPQGVVHALALAPDGTVWAAGSDGVAYRRDGQWVVVDAAEAHLITIGRDGTVWVSDGTVWVGASDADCRVSTLRFDGTPWVRRAVAGCPPESSGLSSLAVDANGALWAVWTGSTPGCGWGGCPQTGLARFDGQGWEAIREVGGVQLTNPSTIATTPAGDVWVVDGPSAVATGTGEPDPIRAARFDGTDWTVVEPPDRYRFMSNIEVAPDGTLWASVWWASTGGGDRGPARYDGTAWTFPYEGAGLPSMQLAAVAPDGTVFASIGSVLRLPDRTSQR